MRGQRLFVRPIERGDESMIRSFLLRHGSDARIPESGLLGKLVGELVAVLSIEVAEDSVRVDDLVVASELRRKRIGRFMLDELEQLARKLQRRQLLVTRPGEAREFFLRSGFRDENASLVRRVRE